ncbi:MAG: response regulator [Candidatus Dormiibacterota bacterium]
MPDGSHAIRLLLVDDDADVASMYELQLSAHGFDVIRANSGKEAIDRASTEAPDLIYLDLGLPEMHGLDVLKELRLDAQTADIPVVILTNYSEPELMERGRQLGAHDFLIKAHTPPAALAEATRRWVS